MEINFTEINNINNENSYDKYWETSNNIKNEEQVKKKKVSFTDILSNMNLVVDNKGVLQFIQPTRSQHYEENYKQNNYQTQEQPIVDHSVKHSYIYNKYFKDYTTVNNPVQEKKIPKTIEEYNQMIYEERIKKIEQKKRADEIKSKKLIFTTNPANEVNTVNPRNIKASKNTLRMMNFS
jgi:hypothetical protein